MVLYSAFRFNNYMYMYMHVYSVIDINTRTVVNVACSVDRRL